MRRNPQDWPIDKSVAAQGRVLTVNGVTQAFKSLAKSSETPIIGSLPPDVHSPEYMPHGHAGASVEYWKARALAAEARLVERDTKLAETYANLAVWKCRAKVLEPMR